VTTTPKAETPCSSARSYPKTAGNFLLPLRFLPSPHHLQPPALVLMLRLSTTGLTSPLLPTPAPAVRLRPRPLIRLRLRALAAGAASSLSPSARSLRLLEWGKVCDAVASFAGTAHGRDATKVSRSDPLGLGCHVSLPAYCCRRGWL